MLPRSPKAVTFSIPTAATTQATPELMFDWLMEQSATLIDLYITQEDIETQLKTADETKSTILSLAQEAIPAKLQEAIKPIQAAINQKYSLAADKELAAKLIKLWPEIVKAAKKWPAVQQYEYAKLQAEHDFPDFAHLKNHKRASKTSKLGAGVGSDLFNGLAALGSPVNLNEIFDYVISDECSSLEVIRAHYKGNKNEIYAVKMFEPVKGNNIEHITAQARAVWKALIKDAKTESAARIIRKTLAIEHAKGSFRERDDVKKFIEESLEQLGIPKARNVSEYWFDKASVTELANALAETTFESSADTTPPRAATPSSP